MAEQPVNAQQSAKFVTVGLKHPTGIILHVDRLEKHSVPVVGGGVREETRAVALPEKIKLNGSARDLTKPQVIVTAGGYALTPNVPADFFREWMKQNEKSDLVVNNLIYAEERLDFAEKRGKEQRGVKSGLQPLNPDKDDRAPKGIEKMTTKEDA
jgi:hypothetical protein